MRKAYSDTELVEEDGKIIGIALGYDYCAEHEWGIKGIVQKLGIKGLSNKTLGYKSRINNQVPKSLVFGTSIVNGKKIKAALIMWSLDYDEKYTKFDWKMLPRDLEGNNRTTLSKDDKSSVIAAWGEGDFGIVVEGEKNVEFLEKLYKAFQNKNVLVGTFKKLKAFCNPSLTFLIKDLLPAGVEEEMVVQDKKSFELQKIIKKLNLEERLRKADKFNSDDYDGIICASPSWNNKKDRNTKHPVAVWINADKNYGWYTVEEVESFIKDKTGKQLINFKTKEK